MGPSGKLTFLPYEKPKKIYIVDFAVRSSIWSGHRIKDSQFQPFSPPLPEEHRQTCDNGIISYRITRVIKEIIPLISIFIT